MENNSLDSNQTVVFGEIGISPPLSNEEAQFLTAFCDKSHFIDDKKPDQGVYDFPKPVEPVYDSSVELLDHNNKTFIFAFNQVKNELLTNRDKIMPGISCPLELSFNQNNQVADAIKIKKQHNSRAEAADWLVFLVNHFFKKDCVAKLLYPEKFAFLKEHSINGVIWQKTGITWEVQKIEAQDNNVYVYYASTPIKMKSINCEEKEIAVNVLNQNAITFDNSGFALHKEQYRKVPLKDIIEYGVLSDKNIINAHNSETLNKLIFNAELAKSLKVKNENTKIVKV